MRPTHPGARHSSMERPFVLALDSESLDISLNSAPRTPVPGMIPRAWIVLMLLGGMPSLALMMRMAHLSVDLYGSGAAGFAIAFAALALIRWACRNPSGEAARILGDTAEYFGLFTAISLVGALASYPVAAFSHGFADAALHQVDLILHFRWLFWYELVAAHPVLQIAGRAAYSMIYISPAILLLHLAWTKQRREAHEFLFAIGIAATITLIAFRFMPAVGPFAYLWHGPIPYMPISELWQPQLIPHLRQHTAAPIDPAHLVGLVSAPSFHTAAAVLLIAFAQRQPLLRGPLIAVNIAMLLSTPVEGTHYLSDMLLGALVAFAALSIVARIRHRLTRFPAPELQSAL